MWLSGVNGEWRHENEYGIEEKLSVALSLNNGSVSAKKRHRSAAERN
jgi:hypothetical protein